MIKLSLILNFLINKNLKAIHSKQPDNVYINKSGLFSALYNLSI